MALTQISTAGVKDDAVTAGKIPADAIGSSEIAANAVGSSELADNAVDTNAIQDDAVTADKLANSINTSIAANTAKTSNATHTGDVTGSGSLTIASNAVTTAKIADDAVTNAKLADDAVTGAKIADDTITDTNLAHLSDNTTLYTAVEANKLKFTNANHTGEVTGENNLIIADNVVDEANLKVSNSPTNGYLLSAQSGNTGGLTWVQSPSSDLVDDTSPQLGGALDANEHCIDFGDSSGVNNDRLKFGDGDDLQIYHDGSNSKLQNSTGRLHLENTGGMIRTNTNSGFFVQSADGDTTHISAVSYTHLRAHET